MLGGRKRTLKAAFEACSKAREKSRSLFGALVLSRESWLDEVSDRKVVGRCRDVMEAKAQRVEHQKTIWTSCRLSAP